MLRKRNNSQKPDDEFIRRFQRIFTDIIPQRYSDSRTNDDLNQETGGPVMSAEFADCEALGAMSGTCMAKDGNRPTDDLKLDEHDFSSDRTPHNFHDIRFLPSWVEQGSMMSLAGRFCPTVSGGSGTMFHNQAGDLHTPTLGLNTTTPFSLPNIVSGTKANHQLRLDHFNDQSLAQHMPYRNLCSRQESYAPNEFVRCDSGYDTVREPFDGSIKAISLDQASSITLSADIPAVGVRGGTAYAEGANFRFNVTLRAPTAMVKHAKEIPVSYLNKGQTYDLVVKDCDPPVASSELHKYRTFIRVSFEEEGQRLKPTACWQLWKEARGSDEACERRGKLLAVEYVDQLQGRGDEHKQQQVQIEQTSFDGFCITWTADPIAAPSGCTIPVRFNFLSTDFTLSKGVKGSPVRLCVKTELLSPGEDFGAMRESEVCYCKVKVFRDHGAERKQSHDIVHVTNAIEKLKQQIAEVKTGGVVGKRRRGSRYVPSTKGSNRSTKASKRKRAWSINSQDEALKKTSLEDDLQAKLSILHSMLVSTRTVSVLALGGDEEDDPDLYPIRLPPDGDFVKTEAFSPKSTGSSGSMKSLVRSPTRNALLGSSCMNTTQVASLESPTIVQKITSGETNFPTESIETVDIDWEYRPTEEQRPKPIACFYLGFREYEERLPDYYRAIYLTERTTRELLKKITEKQDIDPARVARILIVNQGGIRIIVDDDVVSHMLDNQDMIVDICEAPSPSGGDGAPMCTPMEIRLTY